MIIAVDFDGTIVEHRYPAIGKELPFATSTLRQLMEDGHRLILWTVREGDLLQEAVDFCEQRGVSFFAVNKDFEEEDGTGKHFSRKIKADLFIDDRNVGGLPHKEENEPSGFSDLRRDHRTSRQEKRMVALLSPNTWGVGAKACTQRLTKSTQKAASPAQPHKTSQLFTKKVG